MVNAVIQEGIELAVEVVERRGTTSPRAPPGARSVSAMGLVRTAGHMGLSSMCVAGGPQHHHGRGPQALGLVDRLNGPPGRLPRFDHPPAHLSRSLPDSVVAHPACYRTSTAPVMSGRSVVSG